MSNFLVSGKGSISFSNGNSYEYGFPLFFIRASKINDEIVRVYFENIQRAQIPVPPGTFHLDLQTGRQHNDFNGSFFVTWNGRHEIRSNGVTLIQFNNQRQVSVTSTCTTWAVRNATGAVIRQNGQKVALPDIQPQPVVINEEEDDEDEEVPIGNMTNLGM